MASKQYTVEYVGDLSDYDNSLALDKVVTVIKQCHYMTHLLDDVFDKKSFDIFYSNIMEVMRFWVSRFHVGYEKTAEQQRIFQQFFESFIKFLKTLYLTDDDFTYVKQQYKDVLYQGRIYRIVRLEKNQTVRYDEKFVSWSKNKDIPTSYMQSKLCQKCYCSHFVKLTADVFGNYYGIDLTKFDGTYDYSPALEDEQEVVFFTCKKLLVSIDNIDSDGNKLP